MTKKNRYKSDYSDDEYDTFEQINHGPQAFHGDSYGENIRGKKRKRNYQKRRRERERQRQQGF